MSHQPSRREVPFVIRKVNLSRIAEGGGRASLVDQIFMVVAGAIQSKRLQAGYSRHYRTASPRDALL